MHPKSSLRFLNGVIRTAVCSRQNLQRALPIYVTALPMECTVHTAALHTFAAALHFRAVAPTLDNIKDVSCSSIDDLGTGPQDLVAVLAELSNLFL